jgi:ketosteroid isomerase-like protein
MNPKMVFQREWKPDGKSVTTGGNAIDVLRQQSDGSWGILIDNPWATDPQMSI